MLQIMKTAANQSSEKAGELYTAAKALLVITAAAIGTTPIALCG